MVWLKAGYVLAGKYRILKPLGKGGEGSVWLAVHIQTVQLWAIKELKKRGDGEEFHEINVMKKLRHPSLPQIVDVLAEDGRICLVMEYIRGRTLAELLEKEGRLPVREVLETGCQMSDALSYLHGQRTPVFHLDIKPANIIRTSGGRLVLVDFGAAKRSLSATDEKERRGTAGYAAPEQYDMKCPVDARSDIYGLGATLYHLISGKQYAPYLSKSRVPACPDFMELIIRTCLQERPEMRWESSRRLYRSLVKAKKKYEFRRQRYRFWLSLLLVIGVSGIALCELPKEFEAHIKEDWNYEELLEEALCADENKSREFYRKAIFLAPERNDAYLQYLFQSDMDAEFDQDEEEFLRRTLLTIPAGQEQTFEEQLSGDPEAYGEFASELGTVYWYDYDGADRRKIAAGWFAKAVEAAEGANPGKSGERKHTWLIRAEIYRHMGSYFDRLGSEKDSDGREGSVAVYWKEWKELLEAGTVDDLSQITRLRFYLESVNQITFLADSLTREGVQASEIAVRVGELIRKTEEITPEEGCLEAGERLKGEILSGARQVMEILEHVKGG